MSSPEEEVMAELRNAWYKVRGTVHTAWNWMSGRNQQARSQPAANEGARIPTASETHEALRDAGRRDPETRAALDQLGGPETVRLTSAEQRTFNEMTAAGGDLDSLRNLQSFAGVGQPGAGEAPRMTPGTATAAQTPVEAGHRTPGPQPARQRPGQSY